jgi:hypothetical protein
MIARKTCTATFHTEHVGKVFIAIQGMRRCLICDQLFSREESREHADARCQPPPHQPIAIVTGRGSKSVHTRQTCQ